MYTPISLAPAPIERDRGRSSFRTQLRIVMCTASVAPSKPTTANARETAGQASRARQGPAPIPLAPPKHVDGAYTLRCLYSSGVGPFANHVRLPVGSPSVGVRRANDLSPEIHACFDVKFAAGSMKEPRRRMMSILWRAGRSLPRDGLIRNRDDHHRIRPARHRRPGIRPDRRRIHPAHSPPGLRRCIVLFAVYDPLRESAIPSTRAIRSGSRTISRA